jgi:hypothetical protein
VPTIWTVGHSNRPLEEFLELLRIHRVERVMDVRRFPSSRRHPHFRGDALAAALAAVGIGYLHLPELGGRRAPRPDSPHIAWQTPGFRGYVDHMESEGFWRGLERVMEEAGARLGRADVRGAVPVTLPPAAHRRCPDGAGIPGGAPPGSRALRPAFASSVGAAGGETADLRRISRAMGNAGSSVLGRLRGATWSPGDLQGGGRVFPWTKRGALLIVCESRLA